MAAKPCDQWHHMGERFVPHGQVVILLKFRLDLFSHFREEDFWRVFFFLTIWLPNHVTDVVIKFFLWTILSQDDPQNFSYWSDVTFYICNYDVITKAPMTSKKFHTVSMFQCRVRSFNFFPWCSFRDTEVQYFFGFHNMAATPRDLWRHNYH